MSHDLMSKAVSIYIVHNTFHESSLFFFYIVNIVIVALLNYIIFIFINLQRSYIKNWLIKMSKKNDKSYIPNNITIIVIHLYIIKPIKYVVFLWKTSRIQKLLQP